MTVLAILFLFSIESCYYENLFFLKGYSAVHSDLAKPLMFSMRVLTVLLSRSSDMQQMALNGSFLLWSRSFDGIGRLCDHSAHYQ